jgi:cupin fold WbuC family metalloprotein
MLPPFLVPNSSSDKSVSFRVLGDNSPRVEDHHLQIILEIAKDYPHKNLRFCYHESDDSPLHIMLILERRGIYYPPHVHSARDELHFVYDGVLEVHTLRPDNTRKDSSLQCSSSLLPSLIRSGCPHLTIPHTPVVLYLEIKNGPSVPFSKECIHMPFDKETEKLRYLDSLSSIFSKKS